MRLGAVAFLMPFFFVLEPALLARGVPMDILIYSVSALAGAILLASGLFGYMKGRTNVIVRLLFAFSGLLLLYPSYNLSLWGIAVAILAFLGEWLFIKLKRSPAQ